MVQTFEDNKKHTRTDLGEDQTRETKAIDPRHPAGAARN